jgi:hypothetical protein
MGAPLALKVASSFLYKNPSHLLRFPDIRRVARSPREVVLWRSN